MYDEVWGRPLASFRTVKFRWRTRSVLQPDAFSDAPSVHFECCPVIRCKLGRFFDFFFFWFEWYIFFFDLYNNGIFCSFFYNFFDFFVLLLKGRQFFAGMRLWPREDRCAVPKTFSARRFATVQRIGGIPELTSPGTRPELGKIKKTITKTKNQKIY